MPTTIYMVVQITSSSAIKPGIKIMSINPSSLAPSVEAPINATQTHSTTTIVHPYNGDAQYQVQVRMDGDINLQCRSFIVGTDDTKEGASHKMDAAVVGFLTREGLNVPVSMGHDDDGVATMVAGVRRQNGENVWWEVVWGEVQGG
ncbi:hypothetical protein GRF29_28g2375381 [Pseudopithomyces chartarum]|uniref:Uncharacterized protein n=1 Tax=Pseudopithomyces chartarum TaxID=1892770 RepID=A0AAN6M4U4_9PLEO|nr:hypothetical protein GRF29_28g2375381 [Pseudopithomyces chartarum]